MSAGRQLLGMGLLGEMPPDAVALSLGMKAGRGGCCRGLGLLVEREGERCWGATGKLGVLQHLGQCFLVFLQKEEER